MTQLNLETQNDSFLQNNIFLRIIFFIYGTICYVMFLGVFLYSVGFASNFLVPKSMDTGGTVSFIPALITDILLLGVFAIQHSGMARKGFKKAWTRVIPKAIERSTYAG